METHTLSMNLVVLVQITHTPQENEKPIVRSLVSISGGNPV